jgi:hypothetical protein
MLCLKKPIKITIECPNLHLLSYFDHHLIATIFPGN